MSDAVREGRRLALHRASGLIINYGGAEVVRAKSSKHDWEEIRTEFVIALIQRYEDKDLSREDLMQDLDTFLFPGNVDFSSSALANREKIINIVADALLGA